MKKIFLLPKKSSVRKGFWIVVVRIGIRKGFSFTFNEGRIGRNKRKFGCTSERGIENSLLDITEYVELV